MTSERGLKDPMNQTEDKKQRNKARTFIQLVESNKHSMYKIARSYLSNDEDIADAIQDAIESCWRNLDQLEKPAYFRTWMTRILIHKCIDIIRKNRREHLVSDFPEYGAEHKDLDNYEFSELMKSLDEKYRTILLLYYGEGFKISEIAQLLDMEENTVKTRLSRGRQKFRMMWDSQDAVRQS